jgi:cytolysin (calcineurin-like family phosphatase)
VIPEARNHAYAGSDTSDPKQAAWARSFISLIEELQKYVKQYHTTGVTWNPKVR